MLSEVVRRSTANLNHTDHTVGDRTSNTFMALQFISSLMSPAYSIFNAISGQANAWAVLAADWGVGATEREFTTALWELNPLKIYASGVVEMIKEGVNAFRAVPQTGKNWDDYMLRMAAKVGPGFLKVVNEMIDRGFGVTGGVESPDVSELGQNWFERGVMRTTRVARAIPEAVETVNRYVTAYTAWKLAKRAGWADAKAGEYAVSKVEQTQGGYSRENNPTFMSGKARAFFQFRKYPIMIGQL